MATGSGYPRAAARKLSIGLDYQPRSRLDCVSCARREGGVVGERNFMRVGAGALVVGTVLAFVFNLIHPRSSDALDSTRGELELVAGSDIWLFDRMMLEVADAWAQNPDDPALLAAGEAVVQISLALFTAVIGASFGVTPIAFGLAILASGAYARGFGWVSIAAGGLGFVTAMIQFLAGPSNLTAAVLFPIASLSFTLVAFVLGVQLWRRSETPAPTAAAAPPTPSPAGG